jgi:hypothetical protein
VGRRRGLGTWEEVNRLTAPTGSASRNFGWPCYEGADGVAAVQPGYQGAGLNQCSSLYGTPGSVAAPYYAYDHSQCVVSYPGCATGGSSITGVAFYQGGSYPAAYFSSWSDGGAQNHTIVAPATSRTYTATYRKR